MTANPCVSCGRPTPDGYACVPCAVDRPRQLLAEIAEMAPAARDIAQRQARNGAGGAASGKPGSSLPIDLGATARLDAVQGVLTTWVRHVAEERGVNLSEINADGLTWLSRSPVWVDQAQDVLGDLEALAQWLGGHCEWMRHRPEVDEFLTDVEAAARVVRGIARGPGEQKYLGPCGADLIARFAEGLTDTERCEGDVYGWAGADKGACRTCGAQVVQAERRAWLDEQTAGLAAPARDIAYALGVNPKTLRSWATERRSESGTLLREAKLRTYYRAGEHVVPWTDLPEVEAERQAELRKRGPRLHYVGDVRQLAAEAAARRAENEARRIALVSAG